MPREHGTLTSPFDTIARNYRYTVPRRLTNFVNFSTMLIPLDRMNDWIKITLEEEFLFIISWMFFPGKKNLIQLIIEIRKLAQ